MVFEASMVQPVGEALIWLEIEISSRFPLKNRLALATSAPRASTPNASAVGNRRRRCAPAFFFRSEFAVLD